MLTSKLYGQVVVIGLRPMSELRFSDLLAPKFSEWSKHTETVEVAGAAPLVIKGISMPARKEKLTIYKHENLVYIDLSPTLCKATVYQHVRSSSNPATALHTLLSQISAKAQQSTVLIDRLELLVSLVGQLPCLDLIKQIRLQENLFPFFAHCDTSLIQDTDNFKTKLQKVSNGVMRIT